MEGSKRLYLGYTRYGGETTYINPTWRINEWRYPEEGLPRRIERGEFDTYEEAKAEAQRIALAEGKRVERIIC